MNIGIIGTGNIASFILEQVNEKQLANGRICAVFGRNREVGEQLEARFGIEFHTDLGDFLSTPVDTVVEAVVVDAAKLFLPAVVRARKDLIISSIGVFKDAELLKELEDLATVNGTNIYLPSGAIGGLDLLQSANARGGLEQVQITTRKSPASLGLELKEAELLFEGNAAEAIERFPKNVNVALVIALAGLGAEKTQVQVIADPAIVRNTHTIEAHGDFGKMELKIENNPMPSNPKTSLLAGLSILSVLQRKDGALRIGS